MFGCAGDKVAPLRMQGDGRVDGGMARLGAATCKNDFVRFRPDQSGYLRPGQLDRFPGPPRKTIPAGGIGPVLGQKRSHRFPRFRSEWRGRIVVEIDQIGISHDVGRVDPVGRDAKGRSFYPLSRPREWALGAPW